MRACAATKFLAITFGLILSFAGCEENSSEPKYGETPSVKSARGRVGIGELVTPEINLTRWIDGKDGEVSEAVQLSDYKGKFLILNFWATWCAPCVAEMPALERLYQKLKGKGLEVIAVNVEPDARRLAVKTWFADKGLKFPLVFDHKMLTVQNFGVTGFPETFFISPAGKLLVVKDPESGEQSERLISDRPWDSPLYLDFVSKLMEQSHDAPKPIP